MRIAEIFLSIHGECNGHHQGRLVNFIRLAGCNLQCSFCDTPETQNLAGGVEMTQADILQKIAPNRNKYVCITGGEPFMQTDLHLLLKLLHRNSYKISIETNGTLDISPYFRYVESFVVDYKFEYPEYMHLPNFNHLRPTDVIKFVVKDFDEVTKAFEFIQTLQTKAILAFSPVEGEIPANELAEYLKSYAVYNPVFSLQIHKTLKLK